MHGEIQHLDVPNQRLMLEGQNKHIYYDKILLAPGSYKHRLNQEYSNAFYLEDRQAHARVHNEILKAKTIVILGGTLEAYQTAAAVRDYLDEIEYYKTQVVVMVQDKDELK